MPESLEKSQLLDSYMSALKLIFIVCCVLSAAALFASVFTQGFPLDKALETDQGFQRRQVGVPDDETKTEEQLA
jgi:hypothetical protein